MSVVIDSRKVKPGDTFVAIKGLRVDGHDFIEDAIQLGATAIVSAREPKSDVEKSVTFTCVPDTLVALGKMAAEHRLAHDIPVVGITGSCGKTSVKGMLGSIMSQRGPALVTAGNMNNEYGLPLTVLQLDKSHTAAVIEMGATKVGDIAYLCDIAKPTVSIITLVAPGHLNGFGSLDGVALGKGEIYQSLPTNGIAVVNLDEPYHTQWLKVIAPRQTVSFGLHHPDAQVRASNIQLDSYSSQFQLHLPNGGQYAVSLPIPGQHMIMNALAACAAAYALGVSPEMMVQGLAAYSGTARRLAMVKGWQGSQIIDDSYNANPVSMRAAIEVLAGAKGERILVMGDMLNLGPDSDQYHQEMGVLARERGIEHFLGIGKSTALATKAFGPKATWFQHKGDLVKALKPLLHAGSVILVKGSLSMGMAEISDAIILNKETSC